MTRPRVTSRFSTGGDRGTPPDDGGRRRIGYYVHHVGTGHLTRAIAILAEMEAPATVLTSLDLDPGRLPDGVDHLRLPPDVGDRPDPPDPTAGGALHWAPLAPDLLGPRTRVMVEFLTRPDVAALVCDVSTEAVLLARLCGVVPIAVRQLGDRTDPAHELAWRAAVGILAPFPAGLDDPTAELLQDGPRRCPAPTPTFHAGFVTAARSLPRPSSARHALGLEKRATLVVAVGGGGTDFEAAMALAAAAELPDWQVVVIGAAGPTALPRASERRVRFDGWVDDAGLHLAAADVVVASAGSNLVAEVAMAARPLIAVAERRPFEEQLRRVEGLDRLGVAVGLPKWPSGDAWPQLVSRARSLGGDRLRALAGGTTPADCARWIVATAGAAMLPDTPDTPERSVR